MRKKRNVAFKGYRTTERTPEATEKLLFYCLAHLSSPSAVRRPQLSIRNGLWIALLRPGVEKGILGIGASVESALRAFDSQYLSFLNPSAAAIKTRHSPSRGPKALGIIDRQIEKRRRLVSSTA